MGTPWTMCRTSALQRAGVSPAALSASVRRVSAPGPELECVAAAVPGTVLTALWRNGTFADVADPAKGPYWEDALGCAAKHHLQSRHLRRPRQNPQTGSSDEHVWCG